MNTTNSKLSARLHGMNQDGQSADGRNKNLPPEECAAIEIQREEHELKADPKDVLKAVFMWKDNPEQRADN